MSIFSIPQFDKMKDALIVLLLVIGFIIMEWIGREGKYAIENIGLRRSKYLRHLMYIIIIMLFLFSTGDQQFIYFQF